SWLAHLRRIIQTPVAAEHLTTSTTAVLAWRVAFFPGVETSVATLDSLTSPSAPAFSVAFLILTLPAVATRGCLRLRPRTPVHFGGTCALGVSTIRVSAVAAARPRSAATRHVVTGYIALARRRFT